MLSRAVGEAVRGQDSIAPVLALAEKVLATPALRAALPPAAAQALAALVGLKLPAEEIGPARLKQALARSGLFQEARLAAGDGEAVKTDAKSTLLALTAALGKPPGEAEAPPRAGRPPAPLKGEVPAPRPAFDPPPAPATPAEAAEKLRQGAEAALDRVRLLQYQSLADGAPTRPETPGHGPTREWMAELPVQIGRETHVLPFRITREGGGRSGGGEPDGPVWKIAFGVDVEPLGPVHARLTLVGDRLGVRIWAERPEIARAIAAGTGDLRKALAAGALDVDELAVAEGRPDGRGGKRVEAEA